MKPKRPELSERASQILSDLRSLKRLAYVRGESLFRLDELVQTAPMSVEEFAKSHGYHSVENAEDGSFILIHEGDEYVASRRAKLADVLGALGYAQEGETIMASERVIRPVEKALCGNEPSFSSLAENMMQKNPDMDFFTLSEHIIEKVKATTLGRILMAEIPGAKFEVSLAGKHTDQFALTLKVPGDISNEDYYKSLPLHKIRAALENTAEMQQSVARG